jgi:hypothetical protein
MDKRCAFQSFDQQYVLNHHQRTQIAGETELEELRLARPSEGAARAQATQQTSRGNMINVTNKQMMPTRSYYITGAALGHRVCSRETAEINAPEQGHRYMLRSTLVYERSTKVFQLLELKKKSPSVSR